MSVLDLPPTPADADPVILPGLLSGLGTTPRQVPAWITDPAAAESIALGHMDIDTDFMARDKPTLRQIEKRIAAHACFYLVLQQARVAELERRVAEHRSTS